MTNEPLPDEVAVAVVRVDELVRHFEEHPDPLVRDQVIELLQRVDRLHRAGLARLANLVRVAGLESRAVQDAEVRLLYMLYDLDQPDGGSGAPAAASPRGSFVPLSNLVGDAGSHA
ncbi:MAG: hypothetical protein M3336_14965 [Chloroflexota bacterium]|nr:hypothetical protein [Chloroflexota bacterium]